MGKGLLLTLLFSTCSLLGQELLVLDLESAAVRALEANRQIEAAREGVEKAVNSVALAKVPFTTKVSPNGQLGYSAGASGGSGPIYGGGVRMGKRFAFGPTVNVNPNVTRLEKRYTSTANASLVIPLIRGAGYEYNLSGVRTAEFGARKAERDYYLTQVKAVLDTYKGLYEMAKRRELAGLAEAAYKRVEGLQKVAERKKRIGLTDELDIYRIETELRIAREEHLKAQEAYQGARDTLLDRLALPLNTPIEVAVPFEYQEIDLSEEEAIAVALQQRVELDQSYDTLTDARRMVRVAKKGILPQLDLEMKYNICGTGQEFIHSCTRSRVSEFKAGINTSADLNRGAERLEHRQKQLGIAAAKRSQAQVHANVVTDVKKALRVLERSLSSIELQYEQVKIAKAELKVAEAKFVRDMVDNLEVIKAEKGLKKAQNKFLAAIVDRIVGEYQLLAAMGILVEKPQPCRIYGS